MMHGYNKPEEIFVPTLQRRKPVRTHVVLLSPALLAAVVTSRQAQGDTRYWLQNGSTIRHWTRQQSEPLMGSFVWTFSPVVPDMIQATVVDLWLSSVSYEFRSPTDNVASTMFSNNDASFDHEVNNARGFSVDPAQMRLSNYPNVTHEYECPQDCPTRVQYDLILARYSSVSGTKAYITLIATLERPQSAGDLNGDGLLNNQDINAFVRALTDWDGYRSSYPTCHWLAAADINDDALVNNQDINPFVRLLVGIGSGDLTAADLAAVPEPATLLLLLGAIPFWQGKKRFALHPCRSRRTKDHDVPG